jgi:hypothetical protein
LNEDVMMGWANKHRRSNQTNGEKDRRNGRIKEERSKNVRKTKRAQKNYFKLQ